MKYFIGHLIEGEISDYYDYVTSLLADKFQIKNLSEYIPPHFTFKLPFEFNDKEKLSKDLEGICKKINKTSYEVVGFDKYFIESKTIYLDIKTNSKSYNQIEKIIELLSEIGNPDTKLFDDFRLHASIARYLTQEELDKIWNYLKDNENPKYSGNLDNLCLFKFKNEKWEVARKFELD